MALARTIVIEPQVLLLDEPLSNLDKTLRVQMRQELLALQRRLGMTTIFVTHDQEEAMTTADRMAVLDKGVVQQVGTPSTLYDDPVEPLRRRLRRHHEPAARARALAPRRALTLDVDGVGDVHFPLHAAMPDAHPRRSLMLSFRPHSLRVEVADAARDARFVWMPGTVEASEFLGEFTRYRVRVGAHNAGGRPGAPRRPEQVPGRQRGQSGPGAVAGSLVRCLTRDGAGQGLFTLHTADALQPERPWARRQPQPGPGPRRGLATPRTAFLVATRRERAA